MNLSFAYKTTINKHNDQYSRPSNPSSKRNQTTGKAVNSLPTL